MELGLDLAFFWYIIPVSCIILIDMWNGNLEEAIL